MRTTGPHPLRAREWTTPHPEGLTTRLVPVEVDLKQQIFDVCSSLAGSTGRRNTGVKSLCWCFKLQGLVRAGFLTSAAGKGASIFKMMDVSRHKSVDTLRGYIRDAELFKDHAGAGLL
jgi:hypothetical protein